MGFLSPDTETGTSIALVSFLYFPPKLSSAVYIENACVGDKQYCMFDSDLVTAILLYTTVTLLDGLEQMAILIHTLQYL